MPAELVCSANGVSRSDAAQAATSRVDSSSDGAGAFSSDSISSAKSVGVRRPSATPQATERMDGLMRLLPG